jgi:hypothetical protein
MMLAFPNDSRSYDATRRAVRFWGYDSALECSFFVTDEALKSVASGMRQDDMSRDDTSRDDMSRDDMSQDETAMLRAFDANRDCIREAATRVYERGTKGSYELGVADLRRTARAK